jgi:hypothetical protein
MIQDNKIQTELNEVANVIQTLVALNTEVPRDIRTRHALLEVIQGMLARNRESIMKELEEIKSVNSQEKQAEQETE